MISVALKMLLGAPGKSVGIVLGMMLATALVIQQGGLFHGLMLRAQNLVLDARQAEVWVMHPATPQANLAEPIAAEEIYGVRSVDGVAWAAPITTAKLSLSDAEGRMRSVALIGLDDAHLAAAPTRFYRGSLDDLRRPDAIAMDRAGYAKLWPGAPLKLGRVLTLNGRRAVIAAITEPSAIFGAQAVIHTRLSAARAYAPAARGHVSFILVGLAPGAEAATTAARIAHATGLKALPAATFAARTVDYYMANTGIAMNFFITIALGVIVGAAVVGMMFGLFVIESLPDYAALKMLGASNGYLTGVTAIQLTTLGGVGYGFGLGLAKLFFLMVATPTSAFRGFELPWQIPAGAFVVMTCAALAAAGFALWRALSVEATAIFRGVA